MEINRRATETLDRFICRPAVGIPLLLAVVAAVFHLTFSGVGGALSHAMEETALRAIRALGALLRASGAPDWFCRFLTDGVLTGLASELAFLPQTAILFFSLAALRECGYLARAALAVDGAMRCLGLSGRAVLPILIALGCNVPAIAACETEEESEKRALLGAIPFLPCSARLPVLLFAASLFPGKEAETALLLLGICLAMAALSALISGADAPPLPLALPPLCLPSPAPLLCEVKQKLAEFLLRAGTVVLLSEAVLDLAAVLTPALSPAASGSESLLAAVCRRISPIFAPLGFRDGRAAAALIAGIFAKESIVSTLTLLSPDPSDVLGDAACTLSFAVFSLTYLPCVMTLAALWRSVGLRKTLLFCLRSLLFAYLGAFLSYTFARFL